MDQDILNLILLGKVKFIDAKYNTQFSLNYELKKSFVCPINDEIVLIHYVGPTNPGITGPVIQVRNHLSKPKKHRPGKMNR